MDRVGVEPTTSPSLLSKAAIYYLLSKLQLWKVKLRLNIETEGRDPTRQSSPSEKLNMIIHRDGTYWRTSKMRAIKTSCRPFIAFLGFQNINEKT
jgi:hypothetical protein